MNVWTTKGRGRKQCATCNKYVGVRNRICACGAVFALTKVKVERPAPAPERVHAPVSSVTVDDDRRPILYTPAGKCPVELANLLDDTIREWADAVRAATPKFRLSIDALAYFVRTWYPSYSSEYRYAVAVLHGREVVVVVD